MQNADFTSLLAEVKGSPVSRGAKKTYSGLSHGAAATVVVSALDIVKSEGEIGLEQSYAFNRQNALRLHVKYAHDHGSDWGSLGLAWHVYF